ncbi:hypothetical protein ACVS3M_002241 [Enterobacter hormaechei]
MNNKHQLLGVPKHANQHRLSRLTMEVHSDELRIVASEVESYTDELIAALEAAEKRTVEMPTFDGYVPHVARELQAAFRIACDNAGINVAADTDEGDRT